MKPSDSVIGTNTTYLFQSVNKSNQQIKKTKSIGDMGGGDAKERGGRGGDARRVMGGRRRAAIDDGRRKEWAGDWDGWEMGTTSRELRRKEGSEGKWNWGNF